MYKSRSEEVYDRVLIEIFKKVVLKFFGGDFGFLVVVVVGFVIGDCC